MLSGRYPSDELADLRPRLAWDRVRGELRAREGARRVAVVNAGTIPDRGLYGVFLGAARTGQARVGELDEEMVFESRVGRDLLARGLDLAHRGRQSWPCWIKPGGQAQPLPTLMKGRSHEAVSGP